MVFALFTAAFGLQHCTKSQLGRLQPSLLPPPNCNVSKSTRCIVQLTEEEIWSRRPESTDDLVYYQNRGDFAGLGPALDRAFKLTRSSRAPPAVDVVIDGGANNGLSTRLFAQAWPSSTVISLEPGEENYAMLRLHTRALENVVPLRAALFGSRDDDSDDVKSESLRVKVKPGAEFSGTVSLAAAGSANIEGFSMPRLMRCVGIGHVAFLKLDIEGAEFTLLPGSDRGWLRKVSFIYMEMHPSQSDNSKLEKGLAPLFAANFSVLTFPELTKRKTFMPPRFWPKGPPFFMDSYFACNPTIGAKLCADTCASWRKGSELSCLAVLDGPSSVLISRLRKAP